MNIIEVRLDEDKNMLIHQDAPNKEVQILEMNNSGSFREIATIPAQKFASIIANIAKEA